MGRFLFQRIVHNEAGWTRPTAGRLGSNLDAGFLSTEGFAGEDWNFALHDAVEGYVYGYARYRPKEVAGSFSIAFAIYDKAIGWSVVGLYESATIYDGKVKLEAGILSRRARELHQIRKHLGPDWFGKSLGQFRTHVNSSSRHNHWKVKTGGIATLPFPVPITTPRAMGYHFGTATELEEAEYNGIKLQVQSFLNKESLADYDDGGEVEFPEGLLTQKTHYERERSKPLVLEAKRRFKLKHGALFCEVCEFDFSEKYGDLGINFIEAHHIIPVFTLKDDSATRVRDLAMVCSNCHRMLHRRRPWMSINDLKSLLEEITQES